MRNTSGPPSSWNLIVRAMRGTYVVTDGAPRATEGANAPPALRPTGVSVSLPRLLALAVSGLAAAAAVVITANAPLRTARGTYFM